MKMVALFIMLITAYISIDAAAYSRSSSSYHNGSTNGSAMAHSSSSAKESSFNDPERPLTPAEYERLTSAKAEIDAKIEQPSVNDLINLVTDTYLKDPVGRELLNYIRSKLIYNLRIDRVRTKISQEFATEADMANLAQKALNEHTFANLKALIEIIKDDYQLSQYNEEEIAEMLKGFEEYFGLGPIKTYPLALLPEQQLAELIDAAVEGRLAQEVSLLQFIELYLALKDDEPGLSKKQRDLIDIMFNAAVNYNIKHNPTYNLFANDQRQNQLLQTSENIVNKYYATSGRQRRNALATKTAKKSFAQRWFARRK